ncbi:MFS transporter [Streptomyces caniscabiei]|uniref:MFS transporter n=2 Tax=Streptomyces caniscabiei TaxID=2746961 RepID=UPI0029AF8F2E|nr:MFS transporter [Streptomyces caniscabiei]MDX2605442.1 MFS transporter [Streptomyces caniscabiei]MDX2735946.1 MFS transporter [Streptomyces caniscabiei]
MPGHPTDPTHLRTLRIAITAFFALDGFVFAGWVVRIPAIKEQTGASPGALGLALLGVSAGAVVTMMLTGRLCRRFGSHPVTVACAVLLSLSVALPPLTHSALALGAVLLVFGAAFGGINVAFNSAAVDLVAALGRPIMPGFHAAFSLGGMVGAGLGSLVAGSLSPTRHLLGITLIGLLATALAAPALLRHEPPPPLARIPERPTRETGGPRSPADAAADADNAPDSAPAPASGPGPAPAPGRMDSRTRTLVVVLGLIAGCTAYGEGALADWGALHLKADLDASPGIAAVGYSCFALAMTVGRLTGTTLLERLGRTTVLVAGGATATAGMLLGSLAPSVWATLLGFAITGLGLANIFPVAIERAGALAGPGGVATASTLGYLGMLLGPPAIGFMAEWFSLPTALTSVAVLAAFASVIAFVTRHSAAK